MALVEAHRLLQVGVAADEVINPAGLPALLRGDQATQANPERPDGHGIVAAMQETIQAARRQDLLEHPAADRAVEGAGIGVEVRELVHELDELAEVVRVEEVAVAGGVRGDDLHPEFQGAAQDAGILVGSVDHRHGHLATGMTKKRQASGGHAPPELIVLRQGAIDVLAIGQELERPCPARETTLELGERVLAAGMDRDRGHELRVGGTDLEQVVVRHMEGPKGELRAGVIVDFILGKQQGLIHVGPANERTQRLDILFVEVPVGERERHADRPAHDLAQPPQPEAFHP